LSETTSQIVKYVTKKQAAILLGLKERRLRDYVKSGKIRQSGGGFLNAGDVAKLQDERAAKQAITQLTAMVNVPSGLTADQRAQLARAAELARQGQSGKPAANGNAAATPAIAAAAPVAAPADAALVAILKTLAEPPPSVPIHQKIFLTTPEAIQYSGLSKGYLDRLVRLEKLKRIEEGMNGHRYRRVDLDSLGVE
jgi:hypothetical protein